MLDLKLIGRKLTELRQSQELTQDDIAEKLFVTHQAVSRWETGKTLPTIDNFLMLIKIYKTSIEDILCLDEPLVVGDKEFFLDEHDRAFSIHEVALRRTKALTLADLLPKLTTEERLYALRLMTQNQIPTDDTRWPRLSLTERIWLLRQWRDKGYTLDIEKIRYMLTPAETKIIREVYHENRKNVAISRQRRTK